MRVMTILGSPRKNGHTATVLEWMEKKFQAANLEIDRAFVYDHNISGCRECWACKNDVETLCVVKDDDAMPLLERLIQADGVVFAAPVFCWGFPAPMKAMLDRMYCLVGDYRNDPKYDSLIRNKPAALLCTAGGKEENNAELLIRGYYNMMRFSKAQPAGHLLVENCKTPEALTQEIENQANELAWKIIKSIYTPCAP